MFRTDMTFGEIKNAVRGGCYLFTTFDYQYRKRWFMIRYDKMTNCVMVWPEGNQVNHKSMLASDFVKMSKSDFDRVCKGLVDVVK